MHNWIHQELQINKGCMTQDVPAKNKEMTTELRRAEMYCRQRKVTVCLFSGKDKQPLKKMLLIDVKR